MEVSQDDQGGGGEDEWVMVEDWLEGGLVRH